MPTQSGLQFVAQYSIPAGAWGTNGPGALWQAANDADPNNALFLDASFPQQSGWRGKLDTFSGIGTVTGISASVVIAGQGDPAPAETIIKLNVYKANGTTLLGTINLLDDTTGADFGGIAYTGSLTGLSLTQAEMNAGLAVEIFLDEAGSAASGGINFNAFAASATYTAPTTGLPRRSRPFSLGLPRLSI